MGGKPSAARSEQVHPTGPVHVHEPDPHSVSFGRTLLFASSADAPRTRRVIDWARLAVSTVALILAGWAAHSETSLDERVLGAFAGLPGWLDLLARLGYGSAGLYGLGLSVTILFRGRRRAIGRDLLVAIAGWLVVVLLAGRATVGRWPDLLPEYFDPGGLSFPAARISLVMAVVLVPAPHLTAPLRKLGRRMVILAAISGVLAGFTTISGLVGALALGSVLAAGVHLLFGSPAGLPSPERIEDALAGLGLGGASIDLSPDQPVGVAVARASLPDGRTFAVKVHGRDAADAELVSKLWRSIWYTESGPALSLTRRQQVEHETVATLLAERQELPVQRFVTAGRDVDDNMFLVLEQPPGVPLVDSDGKEVTDRQLDELWHAVMSLHRSGLSHGSINPRSVVVGAAGTTLLDLDSASLSPVDRQVQADLAATLATAACIVGADRAVDSAIRNLTVDQVKVALPYLQDAVLDPDLRRAVRPVSKLVDLGETLAERAGLDQPDLAEVRRVALSDVLLAVFGILAVNAILSQIAEVGFDTLADQLSEASIGWLAMAFLLGLSGYYGDLVSLRGAVGQPVPTAPTLLLESAKKFVGLAAPTAAARVAMDVRYLQKLGVQTSAALAQGPLIGFVGFLAELGILVFAAWAVGQQVDTDSLDRGNAGAILVVIGVLVVLVAVAAMAVPAVRGRVLPVVKEALRSVTDVIRDPRRIGRIFGGQVIDRITSGLALAATLYAFGEQIPFVAALFVAVGTGLLAGLMPVPGGIGVAEAMMTALLTSVGVPPEAAFSTALSYRLLTSYLPPVLGWFSMRWLTHNGYL